MLRLLTKRPGPARHDVTVKAGGKARRSRYRDEAGGDGRGVAGVHGGAGGDRGQQRMHPAGGACDASRVRVDHISDPNE